MPRQERTKSGTGIYHVMLGMKNNGTFGAIDNLTISYNGNQLVKVTDAAEALNYSDALDFHDGDDTACEYDYDSNGALTRDSNRGIKSIAYDYAHYPSYINMSIGKKIRYVDNDYTADGRKLSSKHKAYPSGNISVTTTDLYIDGLMLRNDAPLLWRFDGGYVDLNANGTPTRWNYYIADHLGSTRMVVDSNDSIRESINYYPFGSEMRISNPALMSGDTSHPFRFTGKELDRQNTLNMYDFGARMFDVAGVPMWTSVDPLAEKYYNVSPYSYCAGNPVMLVDPDGKSTKVKALEDGTYAVIGGDVNDKDRNIYVYTQDENGDYSVKGESIGLSATPTSFYNSDKEDPSQRWGGIINPNDNSGKVFLNNIMGKNHPSLFGYMYNARTGHKYDFKVTNGTDSPIDDIDPQRGMPIRTNLDGSTTYASARDIGNMAAGYVAAKNGISWKAARKVFDWYQGGREGITTVNAELYGYAVLGYNTTAQKILRQLKRR